MEEISTPTLGWDPTNFIRGDYSTSVVKALGEFPRQTGHMIDVPGASPSLQRVHMLLLWRRQSVRSDTTGVHGNLVSVPGSNDWQGESQSSMALLAMYAFDSFKLMIEREGQSRRLNGTSVPNAWTPEIGGNLSVLAGMPDPSKGETATPWCFPDLHRHYRAEGCPEDRKKTCPGAGCRLGDKFCPDLHLPRDHPNHGGAAYSNAKEALLPENFLRHLYEHP
jgi:hypothetical protein